MFIKKYSCQRFAGLKDKRIDLKQGLNVILGPNEAGKSTIVDGIYSTIFKNVRLDKRKDKDFINRYMPFPEGDFIDGLVQIEQDGKQYTIEREWGAEPKVILKTPQGDIVKKEESIRELMGNIFIHGEGTYSSIVFAKQRELKETIRNILTSQETKSTISNILRRTVMEMDKVPVDKLKDKLENEIDSLSKRWDINNSRPEGGRGISNPYKTGVGDVLRSYYEKEMIRDYMEKAEKAEAEFEQVCNSLKVLKAGIDSKTAEINELSKPENDILKRAILTPEIETLKERSKEISEINKIWPVKEYILEQKKNELKDLNDKKINLTSEKEMAKKLLDKEVILSKITKIEEIENRIKENKDLIAKIPKVTEEDIRELDSLYEKMLFIEAKMNAGLMLGSIKSSNLKDIWITKDLEDKKKIEGNLDFKAGGFIKIQSGDRFELQIKSGDMDFDGLRYQHSKNRSEFDSLLKKLGVNDKEQAKLNKKEYDKLNNDINVSKAEINAILAGDDFQDLKERQQELNAVGEGRSLEEIDKDINALDLKVMDIKVEISSTENTLKDWSSKYGSKEKLLEKLVDIKAEQGGKEKELENLASLPDKFKTVEEYKKSISDLRKRNEENKTEYDNLRDDYFDAEKELPDTSYEELSQQFKEKEKEFENFKNRLEKLIKIKSAFDKTIDDMDKDTFKPLAESFSKYLLIVTLGKYKIENIDDSFNLELKNMSDNIMPLDLLSAGTYDSAALALRLSLLEYIIGKNNGFIILDDCLVDLDPERKEKAIELILEYSQENQVIFTTCSPETAKMLGGNIINI
ncbi:MAG: AAA family ATPase [Bacillota bacterium]|nr:AAA family ATPase [Bacillota bacterium]